MRYLSTLLLLGLMTNHANASAHEHMEHTTQNQNAVQAVIQNAPNKVIANKTQTLRLQLMKGNKPLTIDDLKTVHTEKVHLMVIDPTLTDYYHIHPMYDAKNQDYVFDFTPKTSGTYRIWVDITPVATDKQAFLHTDIGHAEQKSQVSQKVAFDTVVGAYQFKLKLDGQAQAGKPVMATISVTKDGKPFNQLEPVMGAFAHMVGFNDDYNSILHVHPMGKEPTNDSERGGSQLMFHLECQKAGFVKLFAQFKIEGKDVYVPFGIMVK